MDTRTVILSGVLPGFIVGLTLVVAFGALPIIATRKGRRQAAGGWAAIIADPAAGPNPAWAAAIATALAALLPIYAFRGLPDALWPVGGADRIWHAAALVAAMGIIAAIVFSVLARTNSTRRLPTALAMTVAAGLGAWAILAPLRAEFVGPGGAAVWGPLLGLIVGVSVYVAEAVAPKLRGWRLPAALLPIAALAAPAHFFAGFAGGAIMLTGVIAALAAALVAGILVPRLYLGGGPAAILIAQLALLHTVTRGFAYDPGMGIAQYLLLACAPMGLLAATLPGIRSRPPWLRTAAATLACAAIASGGAAFSLAHATEPDDTNGSAADYGY